MTKKRFLRAGFYAAVVFGSASAFVAGCSDDENPNPGRSTLLDGSTSDDSSSGKDVLTSQQADSNNTSQDTSTPPPPPPPPPQDSGKDADATVDSSPADTGTADTGPADTGPADTGANLDAADDADG